jgi:hypothetical protein
MAKIGFLATHGVGKTGLCHYTAFYFKQLGINADFLPEIAREAKRLGLPINQETTLEAQEAIQNLQTAWELAFDARSAAGEFKHYACDRTRFDNYAYPRLKFGKKATAGMYDAIMEYNETHPYDILIKIPLWNIDKKITPDGIRDEDKQFQIDIDHTIDEIMKEAGLEYNIIPAKIFQMDRIPQTLSLMGYFDEKFKKIL